ncbi:gamma-glutamyl-gamma-aminobutyrate hydrolase family protein [Paenibacillus sp. Root444D2]|uniref:gamma-glutamyl-gamma-aminobutyrate hydrolase family protein n=1 Tax=Paenibacillus sp. Root444D2 TaxID=1736538 RepID=UPI00070D9EA4|nr:gamma-glutamyl-gamma-aminobutyrate hydrolase family protein [Paenibacillus sp. Root444D2]KQX48897.1 glutamine amidotransferase [Paenibacillus sp. Root444D2]
MKPTIGITSTIVKLHEYSEGAYVHKDYHRSVDASGGLPIVLPLTSEETFKQLIDLCDGVIFTGGEDIDPSAYGEEPVPELGTTFPERDRIELEAIRYTLEADKPLLAICRGVQVLNVALGGTLYQDLPSQFTDSLAHVQRGIAREKDSHSVTITANSYLERIFGQNKVRVNSLHHQALRTIGTDLVVAASSPDGVVEAVENPRLTFAVGVQWHPESMFETDELTQKLFQELITKSKEWAEGRARK